MRSPLPSSSRFSLTVPDEVFARINGETRYFWRAVDYEGDVLATKRRDRRVALEFLTRTTKRYGRPHSMVTDRFARTGLR